MQICGDFVAVVVVMGRLSSLVSTTETVIKTQQIKTLIGRVRNNKRAARAASTLGQFRAVLVNNNVKLPHFQFC